LEFEVTFLPNRDGPRSWDEGDQLLKRPEELQAKKTHITYRVLP